MLISDLYTYNPREGHGLRHDPFNAIIGPRPIGWIASLDLAGNRNLAPYSFFNAFNYTPPILGFCSIGYKDSVRNVEQTGEFVWNLATRSVGEAMNSTAASVGPDVDEFALAGLTPLASAKVKPPRVGESRVSMECKLSQVIQLKTAAGENIQSWLVLGEVILVHIDKSLLKDGIYETAAANPILRAGGPSSYAEITPANMFEMVRPK